MKIIDSFKEDEAVILYDNGKMLDFLPKIEPESTLDIDIMERWKRYFESIGTPYIVCKEKILNGRGKRKTIYVLYKQLRVKYRNRKR